MTFPRFLRRLLLATLWLAGLALSAAAGAQPAPGAVVRTPQVRAELLAHAPDGAGAGNTVWLGLQLSHQPGWHSYWKNPGDSGLPTALRWTLPPGVQAGDIAWPLPRKFAIGTLANYGYEGTVLLPVPLTLSPDFKPAAIDSELPIQLHASWLVCRVECIPEEGRFDLRLPLRGSTALHGAAFAASWQAQPRALDGASQAQVRGNTLELSVSGLPAALQGQPLEFFPETAELIETAAPWSQSWQGALWTARVPLAAQRSQSPGQLPLLLVADHRGQRQGFVTHATVTGSWPQQAAPAAPAEPSPTGTAPTLLPRSGMSALGWWAALAGALLGGLLLNLMPCVFPVLALKVLGFTRHAHERRSHRISGLAYTAGVVCSFVALGALMLALRSAGEQLGWGFQLQSPAMVAALAFLFTVLGLNLAGLFEFGQFLPSRVLLLEAQNPALNAFLSGVLAVAIASPCTAPFMGASLGLALGLPALQALLIFAAMGAGMALPYLAASLLPALARGLPRPGAWMTTLRRAMAFPMLATVVWLVWVLGQQTGIDGAGSLLALLLTFSAVLWAGTLRGRSRVLLATLSIALFALLAAALAPHVLRIPPAAAASPNSDARWQAWAPERVEQALASGVPVLVDFTAAWCVTCQYNKLTTLAHPAVLADLDAKHVTLLRADWTRRDPAITTALGQLGRQGVPVYVLYQAGRAPQLLSEILSVAEVRAALAPL